MKRLSCKRVERRLPEFQLGELSELERAAIKVHLAVCDSCREVADLWAGLPAAVRDTELPPLSPLVERRLLAGRMPPRPRGVVLELGRRPLAVGAALAATIALVIGILYGTGVTEPPAPSAIESAALTLQDATPGTGESGSRTICLAAEQLEGRGVEVAPDCRIWSTPGAVVRVDEVGPGAGTIRLGLERGFAVLEIGPRVPEQRVILSTPAGEIEARGTVFSVEVASDGSETVRVTEGEVEVRDRTGSGAVELLEEGEQVVRGRAPTQADERALARDLALVDEQEPLAASVATRSGPSARRARAADQTLEDLVKQVRGERRARRYRAAAATYQRIIDSFPGTRTAVNALVGLGQLELTAIGRPGDARAHFEAYLAREPAGMLAEEARAGLVRSLDRLGRRGALISAATEYLERHPRGGSAAEMLRRRGDARRRGGSCRQAISDYRRVIERWPGSGEGTRAVTGLDACGVTP